MKKYAILTLYNSCPEGYDYEYYINHEIKYNLMFINGTSKIEQAKLFYSYEDAQKEIEIIKKDHFVCLAHIIVIDNE